MIEPWLNQWWSFIEQSDRSLVFDIGANDGTWTQKFLTIFDKVVSFEPDTRCNEIQGAKYDRRAVWNKTGEGVFYRRTSSLQSSMLPSHAINDTGRPVNVINEEKVQCVTLDDLVSEYGVPGFIKMDIEEAEVEALEGATKECFSRCHWLIEIHGTMQKVIPHIQRLGFTSVMLIKHPFPDADEGHQWIYLNPNPPIKIN